MFFVLSAQNGIFYIFFRICIIFQNMERQSTAFRWHQLKKCPILKHQCHRHWYIWRCTVFGVEMSCPSRWLVANTDKSLDAYTYPNRLTSSVWFLSVVQCWVSYVHLRHPKSDILSRKQFHYTYRPYEHIQTLKWFHSVESTERKRKTYVSMANWVVELVFSDFFVKSRQ